MFYLSVVPQLFGPIAAGLGEAGLADENDGYRRFVVEKPFGHDLASARALDDELHRWFDEHQIFRIDHYLAKETVQNILALRFTNTIFEPLWNRRYVDHVEITVAESLGVEHRGAFYEQAGALRDIVQNHVMQVLALTAMEPPGSFDGNAIRDEKVKLLRSVRIFEPDQLERHVVRAQYLAGEIGGVPVPGYREEDGVDAHSTVETYLALRLDIDNWRWAGVPFFVRTGKRLARAGDRGRALLQAGALSAAPGDCGRIRSSRTRSSCASSPTRGSRCRSPRRCPARCSRSARSASTSRTRATFEETAPEAYERVIHDALVGDATLFIRSDEVDQSWRIVQPLIDGFDRVAVPLARLPGRLLGADRGGGAARRGRGHLARAVTLPGGAARPARARRVRRAGRRRGTALPRAALAETPRGPATSCSRRPRSTGRSVDVFFGDERWVDVQDPGSNEGMARLAFLDEVEPRAIHSHAPRRATTSRRPPRRTTRCVRAEPPIGLVHLGLGPDGHTASLFPGAPQLDEQSRFVVPSGDAQHPLPRLTLTYPALARAELIVFTVDGSAKRDALAGVRRGDQTLPASRVRAARVVWLVDEAAAGDP